MSEQGSVQHFVCTPEEAREIVERHSGYWVSDCQCRESSGGCKRSRADVCLHFESKTAPGVAVHSITRQEVEDILEEARTKMLVSRPFKDPDVPGGIGGICFCCDDCCWYFRKHEEDCDRGPSIERTNIDACTACGACVDACYFHARELDPDGLTVDSERCFGCGLCVRVCAPGAITMVKR
jgi:ferredoxin